MLSLLCRDVVMWLGLWAYIATTFCAAAVAHVSMDSAGWLVARAVRECVCMLFPRCGLPVHSSVPRLQWMHDDKSEPHRY